MFHHISPLKTHQISPLNFDISINSIQCILIHHKLSSPFHSIMHFLLALFPPSLSAFHTVTWPFSEEISEAFNWNLLPTHLHFVLRFCVENEKKIKVIYVRFEIDKMFPHQLTWNHVLTCASVIFNPLASCARSADAKYFCLWNRFSSSATWILVNLEWEKYF